MSEAYLIALGSNMRVPGVGGPRKVLPAAFAALDQAGLRIAARSPVIESAPIGPSLRRYANAACVVSAPLAPREMLEMLQSIERSFGRNQNQRRGQRWRARALDLDIVMWSGGAWNDGVLTIPHRLFRERDFVLGPCARVAGDWRDPLSGLSVRQLFVRLSRPVSR
ncbi:MAG: 2-amino-4-hydroxy-6-hydroxymethyldihydropteridine diphosphokinase [Pseudomonadota bacterium]|nr:2-amino-4-hydroxy-6-hydroxymethyldihydropteridine diphosphokinase [Pseudomonadota bacterium]